MQLKNISNLIFVSPQIQANDIQELAEKGFKTIICNRPDNEESGQPTIKELKSQTIKYGINFVEAPISNGQFKDDIIDLVINSLSKKEKTLMFCRSGRRSIVIWGITRVHQGIDLNEISRQLTKSGYSTEEIKDIISLAS